MKEGSGKSLRVLLQQQCRQWDNALHELRLNLKKQEVRGGDLV